MKAKTVSSRFRFTRQNIMITNKQNFRLKNKLKSVCDKEGLGDAPPPSLVYAHMCMAATVSTVALSYIPPYLGQSLTKSPESLLSLSTQC